MYLTKEQILSITTLKDQGLTNGQVAKEIGCSRETIIRWQKRLTKAGYKVKSLPRGRPAIDLSA